MTLQTHPPDLPGQRFDAIVSECGSCSGHLKEYSQVLAAAPKGGGEAAAAERLKVKVRSFSEFVGENGGLGFRSSEETDSPAQVVVTYHDPCHLGRRYQNVVDQPRELLRSIPGVSLRELTESDSCCGAAGTYEVLHPEISAAVIDRKIGFVRATEASVVVECPSCMMQLSYGARRAGLDVQVLNVSQMCERAAGSSLL